MNRMENYFLCNDDDIKCLKNQIINSSSVSLAQIIKYPFHLVINDLVSVTFNSLHHITITLKC